MSSKPKRFHTAVASVFIMAGFIHAEPVHPNLFFGMEDVPRLQAKVQGDTWIAEAFKVLEARAEDYLAVPTDPYPYTGDHNGRGTVGRALEKKTGTLAFMGYLTGEDKYFRKAVDMVVAAALQSDPEDHGVWLTHLQVGDGARGYAVAYDLLYPHMDETRRAIVREEVRKFGELLYECDTCWGKPAPGVSSCNHNAVHFGALGLCALVLGDQPQWQARATGRIRDFFKYAMDSTGYFTEGHSYANYGLLGALPYSHALQRLGGPDLVAEQPFMEKMTDQFCWKLLPGGGEMLVLNDNAADLGNAGMLIYSISRYGQPEALWSWLRAVGKTYGIGVDRYQGDGLSVPYAILWGDPEIEPINPSKTGKALSHRFASGRVFMRDSWDDPLGTLASFTSGVDFHRGHNHQDENAFTFHAKGEAFAIDPGYWPKGTRSHNTMLVDGIGQIGASRGRILEYEDLGDAVYVKGQAPEAYEWPDLLLGHFQRQVLFGRAEQPYVLIVDDLQCENDRAARYTWLLHTDKENKISVPKEGNRAVITGKKCGGLCDVIFLAGDVELAETDLKGETFNRRGRDYECSRFYKELKAETTA
ncbi:MAG: heparinase II/III family protein, partial [Verrucomicrobiota bacterium]|nr:heparinase II/III family protein [Verrucomicrobiota bacterium]